MRILRIIRIFVIFSSVFEEHIDLFVRALYDRILRSTQEDHPDTTNGRRPGAIRELERFFFFPAGVDKTISRDFCMRGYILSSYTYIYTMLRVFARSTAADNFGTLCAGSTDDRQTQDNNTSSAESVIRPAGYNAARRAVLLTVASIGPLDPPSRIELGPVSYYS